MGWKRSRCKVCQKSDQGTKSKKSVQCCTCTDIPHSFSNVQIANCVKSHGKRRDTLKSNRLLLRPLVRDLPPFIATVPQTSEHTRKLPKPCLLENFSKEPFLTKAQLTQETQKVSSKVAYIMGHLKFCDGTDGSLSQVCTRYSPITQCHLFPVPLNR